MLCKRVKCWEEGAAPASVSCGEETLSQLTEIFSTSCEGAEGGG